MSNMSESESELRMYLVVRDDLNLPLGKAMGQAGHAFATALINLYKKCPEKVNQYYQCNQPKIIVKCKNETALLRTEQECINLKLNYFLVIDAAKTIFTEPTKTCIAIGPCTRKELPKYIQKMQLL